MNEQKDPPQANKPEPETVPSDATRPNVATADPKSANKSFECRKMSDYNNNQPNDEYSTARKLTIRAAQREAALQSVASGVAGGDDDGVIGADFSNLALKPDHIQRPCWTCPDGNIYLEAFHDLYLQAYDFLVAIAEPVARPEFIHQYKLTPYSLYAAVATNIETESIINVLERLSKNMLPVQVKKFVRDCTSKYGKARLVLKVSRVGPSARASGERLFRCGQDGL